MNQDLLIEDRGIQQDCTPVLEDSLAGKEISLFEILTHLAWSKWMLAKVTGLAVLAGLTVSFLLPIHYTATAKIMPPQQTQSTASMLMNQLTGAAGGSIAAMASGGLGLKNPNDIYIALLNSRPVADAIIDKFDLARVYKAKDMTAARKALASYSVITSEKTGLIAISFEDKDKVRAAAIANAYTAELRTLTKTLAVTEASQRRLFYEGQLKQARETLIAAAVAFQQVQQQKGMVQPEAQTKAMIEGLANLRALVAAKQVEIGAKRSYSTDQNPEVELAEKELTSLQAEETRMEQRNQSPGIAGMGLDNIPSAGIEYLRAEHELQYQQTLYDMLMKQYDAAKLDESKDATIIQVVEPAIPPDLKSSPHRAQITILFSLCGWMGACIFAILTDIVRRNCRLSQSLGELKTALISKPASANSATKQAGSV